MKKRWTFALLVVATLFTSCRLQAQWKTRWEYQGAKGPDHWSELDPAYASCNTGREQSPIDIEASNKTALPTLRFESKSRPLKFLVNNGYTIRVNYHDTPGTGNLLIVGDRTYRLTQFHFHRPSEERLHGKTYDMVAHLMYESSDRKAIGVAVLLKAGRANATIQQIWEHMPTSESNVLPDFSHQEEMIPGVDINPAGLLPKDVSYYTYMGSVTAPPCTEGVRWFVLKTPVDISPEQISVFAKLYPHDARPIQPLNGRLVQESQ